MNSRDCVRNQQQRFLMYLAADREHEEVSLRSRCTVLGGVSRVAMTSTLVVTLVVPAEWQHVVVSSRYVREHVKNSRYRGEHVNNTCRAAACHSVRGGG